MALIGHWLLDGREGYKPSLIDYSKWILGKKGSHPGWSGYGNTNLENEVILKENPWGRKDITWACEQNDSESNAEGGFSNITHSVDPTKKYRYSIWMRRENTDPVGGSRMYMGFTGGIAKLTGSESVDSNPYFCYPKVASVPEYTDNWVLVVAHIHPYTLPAGNYKDKDTGTYTARGVKITSPTDYSTETSVNDFRWKDNTVTTNGLRTFLHYSIKPDERAYWYRPRVDLCDGTEPTLEELLQGKENPDLYTLIEDKSGNENHAYMDGERNIVQEGKIGKCYNFNGSSNMAKSKYGKAEISQMTISYWCKSLSSQGGDRKIVAVSESFNTEINNNSLFVYSTDGVTWTGSNSDVTLQTNTWTHVTWRFNNGLLELFVNGIKKYQNTISKTMKSYNNFEGFITIGGRVSNSGSGTDVEFFNGNINDVRIFDNPISDKEIYDISKAKILHYKFNDFQESTENISIQNGQDGINPIGGDGGLSNLGIESNILFRGKKVAKIRTGTSHNFYINGTSDIKYNVPLSDSWTSTVYIKRVDGAEISSVSTYLYVSNNANSNIATPIEKVEDGWYKVVRTRDNLTKGHPTLFGCYNLGVNVEYYVAEWQLEAKNHSTPYVDNMRFDTITDISSFENHAKLGVPRDKTIEIKFGGAIGAPYGRDQYTRISHICLIGDDGVDYGLNSNGATWTASSTYTTSIAARIGVYDHAIHHHNAIGAKWYKCTLPKERNIKKIKFFCASLADHYNYKDTPKNIEIYINGVKIATKTLKAGTPTRRLIDSVVLPDRVDSDHAPQWTSEHKIGSGGYYFTNKGKEEITTKINTPNHVTMSIWIKSNKAGVNSYQIPMAIHNSSYELTIGSNGHLRTGFVINGSRKVFNSSSGLLDGKWHMVTSSYDGKYIKSYIDGLKVGESNNVGNLTQAELDFRIGTYSGIDNPYRSLEMHKDDARVYATALSDEDILRLYKSRFNIDDNGNFQLDELNTMEKAYDNNGEYNLVKNGNQQLKNNDNFPGFTYISTGETGYETDARQTTKELTDFIEFDFRDTKKRVDMSFTLKNTSGNGQEHRCYLGVTPYDKNKNMIHHRYANHFSNTRTTLAQAVNSGDTTIYLTSAANWNNTTSSRVYIAFYTQAEYPIYTYSSHTRKYSIGSVDTVNNTITLESAYSGNTVPAGTAVANCYDGGTYHYFAASNSLLTDGQEKTFTATDIAGSQLRYGTKYIRPLMLLNRNADTGQPYKTLVKDITFTGKYGDFEKDEKVSFQENGVCSSNIDEIGMTEGLVGYWKFNDLSDYSNEQNDLRNFGVNISGGVASFDGNSSLTIPNTNSLNVDYVTIIQVVKVDSSATGEKNIVGNLASYTTNVLVGTGSIKYKSIINSSGSGSYGTTGDQDVPPDEWVFLATTWNGKVVSNYVNDSKKDYNIDDGSLTHGTSGIGIGSTLVSTDGSSKGLNFFKGDMKEVRIYNRALIEEDILTLYKIMMKKTANIKDKILYVNEIKEN